MIRKYLLFFSAILCFVGCETLSSLPTVGSGSVTEAEAGQGIKEALAQGTTTAILNLNKENGFFGNEFYKVLLPPEARDVENTLRKLGLGRQVDKAILQINRAAEDAVGYARPVFVDAIKQMTIADAINIVRGERNAATSYFRTKTGAQLIQAFSPSVRSSLDKLEATRYYGDIIKLYNNLPTVSKKLDPDLSAYVVGKATDALFDQIEKEEINIRQNPVARTTEILKRVFGNATSRSF